MLPLLRKIHVLISSAAHTCCLKLFFFTFFQTAAETLMIFGLNKLLQISRCQFSVFKYSVSNRSKTKLLDLLTTMPKEKPHIPKMQAERQQKKMTKVKYPPGIVTLQVLGSGARGAPRSLYIFTDQSW